MTRRGREHRRALTHAATAVRVSAPRKRVTTSSFMFGPTLGEGAYAKVMLAELKSTKQRVAVKVMEKRFIKKEDKVKYVMQERDLLTKLSHPSIVKLMYTFQDREYLYLVLELCEGGELRKLIRRYADEAAARGERDVACPLPVAQYYVASVILVLEWLHGQVRACACAWGVGGGEGARTFARVHTRTSTLCRT